MRSSPLEKAQVLIDALGVATTPKAKAATFEPATSDDLIPVLGGSKLCGRAYVLKLIAAYLVIHCDIPNWIATHCFMKEFQLAAAVRHEVSARLVSIAGILLEMVSWRLTGRAGGCSAVPANTGQSSSIFGRQSTDSEMCVVASRYSTQDYFTTTQPHRSQTSEHRCLRQWQKETCPPW